ncbi:MAG: hypothetical protein KBT36_08965 [Kurthia sp.]|nr:hypothetical protein [Candidatus Kurthia equi]
MFNKYPYSDFHEMNLDWVISKVKELDQKVNGNLEKLIREQLDKLFIDAMYDAQTETLILTLNMKEVK